MTKEQNHNSHHILHSHHNSEATKIHFLILGFDFIYNEKIWDLFFGNVSTADYEIFIHMKHPLKSPIKIPKSTLVATVESAYCYNILPPMIQLLKNALVTSQNPHDKFVFLSSDAIPVKSFSHMYRHYSNSNNSEICVTESNQWHKIKHEKMGDLRVVKQHQWVSLNKHDAHKIMSVYNKYEQSGIPAYLYHNTELPPGTCWEEHFFYTAMNGDGSSLQYPLEGAEQGFCNTYVHWDYPETSIFRSNGVPRLSEKLDQILTVVDVDFYHALKATPNFFFVRKVRSDNEESTLKRGKDVVKIFDHLNNTHFYE